MRAIKKVINDILDKQEQKGIQTYGHSLENCPDEKYDWQQMTIEELIDALQYQVKQNLVLQKVLEGKNVVPVIRYNCTDCNVDFTIELAFNELHEIHCPICGSTENIAYLGEGEVVYES